MIETCRPRPQTRAAFLGVQALGVLAIAAVVLVILIQIGRFVCGWSYGQTGNLIATGVGLPVAENVIVQQPVTITECPGPNCLTPVQRLFTVYYREAPDYPWSIYATYTCPSMAAAAAESLTFEGYESFIR